MDDTITEKGTDVDEDVGTSSQQTDTSENEGVIRLNSEPVGTEPENHQANKVTSIRIHKYHPKELIIGNPNEGITTRSRDVILNACFVSKFEPKNVK